jgi:hypothetical protein
MALTGHCYCGELRYEAGGNPVFQGQCHCRECQYIVVMALPEAAFKFTKGTPRGFRRSDLAKPVTREFCPNCGTHVTTRSPNMPGVVMVKVGTLDDPSVFEPQMAIFTCDKQPFHQVPEGIPAFERTPG